MGEPITLPFSIEAAFVAALAADEDFQSIFGSDPVRIYAASSLGQGPSMEGNPPAPDFPYCVWNELPSQPHHSIEETSTAQVRFFTFWVYDEQGSSITINRGLRVIRSVLKDLAPFDTLSQDEESDRCIDIVWMGFSNTFSDEDYHASVRYATVRFLTSL